MQFIYLLISIYFGRKNPLFYLIFPIALVSGPGVFIDPRTVLFGDDIFLLGRNIYKDVIIVYLLIIVFHLRKHWMFSKISKTPIIFYGLFISFLILRTYLTSGTNYEAINVMRLFTHMILGYFLIALVFSTATSNQFISFFNSLFYITGILSILYVINSANIFPLYFQENLYSEIDTNQGSFFRDFNTIPYFSNFLFVLAFSLLLTQSHKFNRKAILSSLLTYPFVLLYTFTRSILILTLIECVLIIIILAVTRSKYLFRSTTFFILISFFVIFITVQLKFQNELKYFTERISDAKGEGADEENVQVRIAYHLKAYEILSINNSLILGGGINKKFEYEMDQIGAWTVDSTIPFLLIYTGIFGVIIYFYIGLYYLFKTLLQLKNIFNPFSLSLFSFILSSLILSLIMGGYDWGNPLIYYPFVFAITIENLIKKETILLS